MIDLLKTKIGRLRLFALLEGFSLIFLVCIAVPIKHFYGNPIPVKIVGPVHGLLFILFVLNTLSTAIEYKWQFKNITWKVLLSCLIPFGTFYIDRKILSKVN